MTQAPLRLGLIARADNTGLGIQTHNFYLFMQPAKTLVIDIGRLNGNQSYVERYPERAEYVTGFPTNGDINHFLLDLDVVFIAEAAYNPYLYARAQQLGVKVANQYNYEFFDWYTNPHLARPDLFIAPSRWHYHEIDQFCQAYGVHHTYLHCPVDRTALPFRQIRQAQTFLHMAGRPAAHDRNGTFAVIEASRFVTANVKLKLHFQAEQGLGHQLTNTIDDYVKFATTHGDMNKLEIVSQDYPHYADIYAGADVLVLPRRYGGNCLPMNEALSVGLPVIMPDISPNYDLLPPQWLVPARQTGQFTPRTVIDIYSVEPRELAMAIDNFANMNEDDMLIENQVANELAQDISWDTMRPKYMAAFERLFSEQ